jgi:hypothetical protein
VTLPVVSYIYLYITWVWCKAKRHWLSFLTQDLHERFNKYGKDEYDY